MQRTLVAFGAAALLIGTAAAYVWHGHDPHAEHADHSAHASLGALEATFLPIKGNAAVRSEALARADGSAFPANGLEGHWTLLFFGFTSCPDVCPTTLDALTRAARDPASGIAQGTTQIVFVTVDPEVDTPQRLAAYLANFDRRIVGLRGTPADVKRLGDAVGAGFAREAGQMDHSTSVFVLDPSARVAGVLLRASEPARVVADLAMLQRGDARPGPRAN